MKTERNRCPRRVQLKLHEAGQQKVTPEKKLPEVSASRHLYLPSIRSSEATRRRNSSSFHRSKVKSGFCGETTVCTKFRTSQQTRSDLIYGATGSKASDVHKMFQDFVAPGTLLYFIQHVNRSTIDTEPKE